MSNMAFLSLLFLSFITIETADMWQTVFFFFQQGQCIDSLKFYWQGK